MPQQLEDKLRNLASMTSEPEQRIRHTSKFSHIDPEFVTRLLEKGFRINLIAKIYGCSPQTLTRYMKAGDPGFNVYNYTRWGREEITVEDVVELYNELGSTTKVGKIFGVKENVIIKRLKKVGIKRKSTTRRDITVEKVAALYRIHRSTTKISELLNVSSQMIIRRLKKKGIDSKQLRKDRKKRDREKIEREARNILEHHDEGMGLVNIAKKYHVCSETIRNILTTNGRKVSRGYYIRKDIPPELVATVYRELRSTKLTAERLNTNENTIRRRLRIIGIEPKKYRSQK